MIFNHRFKVPLRLTMTNPLIKEEHLTDVYANFILRNLQNGFNQILVSSSILEKYIREKYPNYPIIRSVLAAENKYYDDSDKYFMSVLRRNQNNNIDFLKQIKNKDKIEILVNEFCNPLCPRNYSHYEDYAKANLMNPNNEDLNLKCNYEITHVMNYKSKHPHCISREQINSIYRPLGFKHFKIAGRGTKTFPLILDYAHYFVKEEYKNDFINYMAEAYVKDRIRHELNQDFVL